MTSPDRPDVDGSYDQTDIGELANITEENYRMMMANKVTGGFFENRDSLFGDGFLGGIAKALGTGDFPSPFTSIREGAEAGANALIGGIADAIRGDGGARFAPIRQAWEDGQQAATDLWRRLSPLEEYAAAYMDASWSLDGTGRVPFGRVLVGSKGVTPNANSFVLNDFGLWKIDAQIWPSWWLTSAGSDVAFEIRVLRPNGSIYHRKLTRTEGRTADHPLAVSTSVVVPDVGYRVEAVITSISPGRGLQGGSDKTHLIVHHINRAVPGPGDNTGQN